MITDSNTIKFQLKYIEFQAIVAYLRNCDIEVRYLTEGALELFNFIESYANLHNVYPTVDYIESCTDYKAPENLLTEEYINEELKNFWLAQQIQKTTSKVANLSNENPRDALDKLTEFTFEMNTITNNTNDIVLKFSDIDKRLEDHENKDNKIVNKRCDFGLKLMDENTGGLCDGDLSFLVASSNQGKSWLAKYVAIHNVLQGKRVVLLPFEEMAEESIRRLDSVFGQVSSTAYINKVLDGQQVASIKQKALAWKLTSYPRGELWIPDIKNFKKGSSIDIVKIYKKFDADLVIVDQLSFVAKSLEWQDVGGIVRELKDAAMSIKRPLLCLTQAKINLIKGIEDISMEAVALGEEISRNADSVIYIGNHRDSDQVGTKFLKLIKTRRGRVNLITRNVWNIDFSTIQEINEFIPEIKPKKPNTYSNNTPTTNSIEVIKPEQYTTVWQAKR